MHASPFRTVLLDAQTVDETTSIPISCANYVDLVIFLQGNGTTSSGVITIEEADYPDPPESTVPYGGTWSTITTLNVSDVSGGKQLAYHFSSPASYAWVLARISTVIGGGGSVTVVLRGSASGD